MTEITVSKFEGELRADSRTFAPKMDIRHRQLMDNIRKYKDKFDQLGFLPFETEEIDGRGQPEKYALLNEDQAYFMLTLSRNTDAVVSAKLALVKAFRKARSQIVNNDTARIEGKKARLEETNAIKELVQYATDQGSKSAKMYYVNITKMTNQILGIDAGQRDKLPPATLDRIRLAETMIDVTLRDGIRAGLHYKQIYALAKEKVLMLVPLLPKA
jgi:phage regulator Rha-like protein